MFEQAMRLEELAQSLTTAAANGDARAVLRDCERVAAQLVEVASAAVERGADDGLTQREMAHALGIPESALRGVRRERGLV